MRFPTAITRRISAGKQLTTILPVAALATAALTLTACSPTSGHGSTASSAPSTPSAVASAPASSSAGAPSAAPSSAAPSIPPSGSALRACTTGQLSVQQKDPGVGAGQYYSKLVFTNTSTTSCTMSGYPGVSYVAQNGVQSGNAADRAPGNVTTVTLRPGGTASAQLHDSNGIGG